VFTIGEGFFKAVRFSISSVGLPSLRRQKHQFTMAFRSMCCRFASSCVYFFSSRLLVVFHRVCLPSLAYHTHIVRIKSQYQQQPVFGEEFFSSSLCFSPFFSSVIVVNSNGRDDAAIW